MWIHEHKDWPKFDWDTGEISPLLARCRSKMGRYFGKMEGLGFALRQEANLNILTQDVVTTSFIEGEKLNPKEVRSSIARKLGIPFLDSIPAGRDVDGVVEMMLDATQNYAHPLNKERLFGWHNLLFPTGRSGMHKITVANFRTESAGAMQVVSGKVGAEKVHFEAPAAKRLDDEIHIFLKWLNNDPEGDPVIHAAIAHFWFITIHPFEDGNGRIARAIADMMLARADGTSQRFYSMSKQTELERKTYYLILERQQKATPDITEWLMWFLECLERAVESADIILDSVLYKAEFWACANQHRLSERQMKILNRMLDGFRGYMQTAKYAKITKCSPDTALRDLKKLVAYGLLIQNESGGRSTSYRLPSREELKQR